MPTIGLTIHYDISGKFFMALHHATSGERIDVRPLRDRLRNEPTKTLFKSDHLEVIRTVLAAGKDIPAHHVAGESTVQCLEGCLELTVGRETILLRAGELICVAGGEEHAFMAIQDCSLLRTLVLMRYPL